MCGRLPRTPACCADSTRWTLLRLAVLRRGELGPRRLRGVRGTSRRQAIRTASSGLSAAPADVIWQRLPLPEGAVFHPVGLFGGLAFEPDRELSVGTSGRCGCLLRSSTGFPCSSGSAFTHVFGSRCPFDHRQGPPCDPVNHGLHQLSSLADVSVSSSSSSAHSSRPLQRFRCSVIGLEPLGMTLTDLTVSSMESNSHLLSRTC